ncbi:MAG: M23 family metallopeptidase [Frankiaceae bacterium]|nr:M23 family metallopeptidase [Frankiaceae bacterium]MBV9368977.1 M23 family metallopeptidase [Frankiales bacterium]
MCAVAAVAAPVTVLVTAGSASAAGAPSGAPSGVPALTRMTLLAAATVTKGQPTRLTARLSAGPLNVANRPVQFVVRPAGSTTWTGFATATTDANGVASIATRAVTGPTEFGAYYAEAAGVLRSNTASTVVHTIDLAPSAPAAVTANAPVRIAGHLLKDGTRGIASQPVKVWLRASPRSAWSAPLSLRTNSYGIATLATRFTRTTQVGIRFPGANGLAASPLAIRTVTVKAAVASTSGFVFPFANPRQVESSGSWSRDQGIDMFAQGNACGANAILVAVGDGVVIQEGISGFGPTAPVLRMTSGPFKGRNVYYGHTGHVYVPVGAHVQAGQRLAQIGCGSVGYSSGPHLEIGVGVPGGPPCCPGFGQTSGEMLNQLLASLRAALS